MTEFKSLRVPAGLHADVKDLARRVGAAEGRHVSMLSLVERAIGVVRRQVEGDAFANVYLVHLRDKESRFLGNTAVLASDVMAVGGVVRAAFPEAYAYEVYSKVEARVGAVIPLEDGMTKESES